MGAHTCNKSLLTFEKQFYASRTVILSKFLMSITDMMKAKGVKLAGALDLPEELRPALMVKHETATQSSKDEVEHQAPLSVEELGDKSFIAKGKGFKVGTQVFEQSQGPKEGIYQITSVDDRVCVKELDAFKTTLITATIPFGKFMEGWKVYVGEVATFVRGNWDNTSC